MDENPYKATLEMTGSVVSNRAWRKWIPCIALLCSIGVYFAGATLVGIGYGIGMEGFDTGERLPPGREALAKGLMYAGVGVVLASYAGGAGSLLLLLIQLIRLVFSYR